MIPETMYRDIERQLMPMIRRKASRLRGYMDLDDAIQEARVVLFKALQSYDYNRQPDLERYVGVCLNNAFAGQYNKATAQRRMPRRASFQSDGTYVNVPVPPASMDVEPAAEVGDPEWGALLNESEGVMVSVLTEVESRLSEGERAVLLCFAAPPREVTVEPTDSGFNIQVAAYLGLNKNMLDWRLHRIRQTMLEVMRLPCFQDHTAARVAGPGWPHLQHSGEWRDMSLLESTISRRGLDPTVQDEVKQFAPDAERWSITYSWGEALFLRLGETAASLIMEGRFNALSGTLFGSQYGSQSIPVPWYQRCIRAVNGT